MSTAIRSVASAIALTLLLPLPPAFGSAQAQAQAPESVDDTASGAEMGAALITASELRRHIGVLAHDSMQGRDTPGPELRMTAEYVASRFEEAGLRPGLGESYQQNYPISRITPGSPSAQSILLEGPDAEVSLRGGEDVVAIPTGGGARGSGTLRSFDGTDEVGEDAGVLLLDVTPGTLQGAFGRVREVLSRDDAAGAVLVVDAPAEYFGRLRTYFRREQVSLGEADELGRPVLLAHRSALPASLREALEAGTIPSGWSAELRTEAEIDTRTAMNTIGWLPGSDPVLRNEYVVFTAHMDHVGVGEPVAGDSIYNGADDDASGTSTILALAKAYASLPEPPGRSLVFMTVSGEEKGLLGSRWYSEHPVFPLDRTVANLNIDMIGRNWEDTVVAIGKEESTLGERVERIAREHEDLGLSVIDDQWPDENFYFRSDHYNFARKGVPILFFFSGTHEDYHAPSDEIDRIKFGKTARIGQLIYHLGLDVADADERPEWDEEAYRRVVEGADGG